MPPDSNGSAVATCTAKKTLVGGGFGSGPLSDSFGTPVFESHRQGADSWKVSAVNTDFSETGTVSAYAYCA